CTVYTAEERRSHLARSRPWSMTHAATAFAAAGDTAGLALRADSVMALGTLSASGRDHRLHHHVRGLLVAVRSDDEAAITEFRRAIFSWNMSYTRINIALAAALMRQHR